MSDIHMGWLHRARHRTFLTQDSGGEDETESCDKLLKYFHALYEKHPRSQIKGVFDTIEAGAKATAHEVSGSLRDMGWKYVKEK